MGKINLGLDIPTKTWFLEVDKKFAANCNRCKKQLNKSGGFYYCKESNQFWCDKCSFDKNETWPKSCYVISTHTKDDSAGHYYIEYTKIDK